MRILITVVILVNEIKSYLDVIIFHEKYITLFLRVIQLIPYIQNIRYYTIILKIYNDDCNDSIIICV